MKILVFVLLVFLCAFAECLPEKKSVNKENAAEIKQYSDQKNSASHEVVKKSNHHSTHPKFHDSHTVESSEPIQQNDNNQQVQAIKSSNLTPIKGSTSVQEDQLVNELENEAQEQTEAKNKLMMEQLANEQLSEELREAEYELWSEKAKLQKLLEYERALAEYPRIAFEGEQQDAEEEQLARLNKMSAAENSFANQQEALSNINQNAVNAKDKDSNSKINKLGKNEHKSAYHHGNEVTSENSNAPKHRLKRTRRDTARIKSSEAHMASLKTRRKKRDISDNYWADSEEPELIEDPLLLQQLQNYGYSLDDNNDIPENRAEFVPVQGIDLGIGAERPSYLDYDEEARFKRASPYDESSLETIINALAIAEAKQEAEKEAQEKEPTIAYNVVVHDNVPGLFIPLDQPAILQEELLENEEEEKEEELLKKIENIQKLGRLLAQNSYPETSKRGLTYGYGLAPYGSFAKREFDDQSDFENEQYFEK